MPVEELGKMVGVPTPTATAIIEFAQILTERDLRSDRRSLRELGMDHMTVDEIVRYVNEEE